MKVTDTNRFFLPGQKIFLHLATVQHLGRTYICFADTQQTDKIYIEEYNGHLVFVDDDSLVEEIANYLRELKVLDMGRPLLDDNSWLRGYRKPK